MSQYSGLYEEDLDRQPGKRRPLAMVAHFRSRDVAAPSTTLILWARQDSNVSSPNPPKGVSFP